jgi:hypothetical protein
VVKVQNSNIDQYHQTAFNDHRTLSIITLGRNAGDYSGGVVFFQRVVWDVGEKFDTSREAIYRSFLPYLMKESLSDNGPLNQLSALPVKSNGLALTDPVESTDANFRARSNEFTHHTRYERTINFRFAGSLGHHKQSQGRNRISTQDSAHRHTQPASQGSLTHNHTRLGDWSLDYGLTFDNCAQRAVIRRVL